MDNLPDLSGASEGEEIARERINWSRFDQFVQFSTLDEEYWHRRVSGYIYEDEIQHIYRELEDTQRDDLVTQKGIGMVVQRLIDLDNERDRRKNGL